MRFSNRTFFAQGSPSVFSKLLDQKRKDKVFLWDLTESNPTRCGFESTPGFFTEQAAGFFDKAYQPDPRGLLEARKAISNYYAQKNISISPERIFLTSGTSEAYDFLFHLLADPGDEILCGIPGYPLFDHLASMSDIKLSCFRYQWSQAAGWIADGNEIKKLRNSKTKAMVLVNPNNPTGHYAEFSDGPEPLISDEVFLDFDRQDKPRISAASMTHKLCFTLSGISKILGLPQMKISWIVVSGPEEECLDACQRLEVISDAYLSVASWTQRALPGWLSKKDFFINEVKKRLAANEASLRKELYGLPLEIVPSQGGWYAVIKIAGPYSDDEAAYELLDKMDVLVSPGYYFDFQENYLVISLLPKTEVFAQAAGRIRRGLIKYN